MFIDNYYKLCESKGISATKVLNDLGISRGVIANWKQGGTPTNPTKQKISEYFGITISELMSGQTEKPATIKSDELSTLDIQLIQMLPNLSEQEKRMFLAQVNAVLASR